MQVQVTTDSTTTYPTLGAYRSLEMTAGKTSALILLRSKTPTVTVLVTSNANTWRSIGKDYPTLSAAKAHYRSHAMKAMLDHCSAMVADAGLS